MNLTETIPQINKAFTKFNKKCNDPIKEIGRGSEQALLQGKHTENRKIKKYSFSLIIRKLQIKMKIMSPFLPVEWPTSKSLKTASAGGIQ